MSRKHRVAPPSNPDPLALLNAIQPAPGEPAVLIPPPAAVPPAPAMRDPEPTAVPIPMLPIDAQLAARNLTRRDIAYTMRGQAMQHRGWHVDYVRWEDPLTVGFEHVSGRKASVACKLDTIGTDGWKEAIAAALAAA